MRWREAARTPATPQVPGRGPGDPPRRVLPFSHLRPRPEQGLPGSGGTPAVVR